MKLVRDNIIDIMKDSGLNPNYHIAGDIEYLDSLNNKLLEEINEYYQAENVSDKILEIADIMEILESLIVYYDVDKKAFELIKNAKADKNGKFTQRIILE